MRVYNKKKYSKCSCGCKDKKKPPNLTPDLEKRLENNVGSSCIKHNDGRIFCGGTPLPKKAIIR